MDTYATASYLRGLTNNGKTFTLDVRTISGSYYARLGMYSADDLGIRVASYEYTSLIIPWTAIESIHVEVSD